MSSKILAKRNSLKQNYIKAFFIFFQQKTPIMSAIIGVEFALIYNIIVPTDLTRSGITFLDEKILLAI